MSRRGWILFAAMSVIWGMPYLFIKVAVEELAPPVVVFSRSALASLALVPLAIHRGALRPVLARWRPLVAFTALEMALPWLLLTHAETRLPSGVTGLLIATVPIAGTVVAYLLGDHHALRPARLVGLAVGLCGVALLVGFDLSGGSRTTLSVVEVLLVVIGYASAPFIAARRLNDVPSLGVVAASLALVAIVYLPLAVAFRPAQVPSGRVVASIVALAVICTGTAFVVFFALIAEVGPARATLITFVNPAVAVVLGALVLGEAITGATLVGFALVLAGCWLATRPAGAPEPAVEVAAP